MPASRTCRPKARRVLSSSRHTVASGVPDRVQRTELCKRCKKINLDAIFNKKHLTSKGNRVRGLGPVRSWSADSCPLCNLMLQMLPISKRGLTLPELRSFSSKRIPERGWQAVDTVMLSVASYNTFLVKASDDSNIVRTIGPKIDFEVIKTWLQYCQDNHSSACSGWDTPRQSGSPRSPSSSIQSFRLIDSVSRKLVNGSNRKYVALSYVWGQGEKHSSFSETLPDQLPNTIQDAITVTRAIGLRYLWIDRYCINQEKPDEVKEQITQMDLIYNCAYLTVIAAAGEGPHYGLPGAGNRTRDPQPKAAIGQHSLISSLSDPVAAIKKSKWFQRGWTYQEGILSRSRLIFVDEQVYFECSGMYCCEALDFPLEGLHTQSGGRFKAPFCNGVDIGIFPRKIGASQWEIVKRIEDYTKRQLTNPRDILDGISGILQAFEKSGRRALHCAGVPMIPAGPKRRKADADEPSEWSPVAGFCVGLCWTTKSPSQRREGFPSWSWTGWKGEVEWQFSEHERQLVQANEEIQASVQLQDGRVVDWKSFCQSYNQISQNVSGTLHIAAWGTPMQVTKDTTSKVGGPSYEAIVEVEDKGPCIFKFQQTGTISHGISRCIGIHLCHNLDEFRRLLYLLVVHEVDQGIYERVGLGTVSGDVRPLSRYENDNDDDGSRLPSPLMSFWLPLPVLQKSWHEFRLR